MGDSVMNCCLTPISPALHVISSGTAVAVNSLGEVLVENPNGSFSIQNSSSQAPTFSIANWSPGGAASACWNKLHQIVAGDQLLQPPSPAALASNPEATPTTHTLENLLPAGWSGVNATGINDAGEIIATANYSGADSSIGAGQHGVLLLPVQINAYRPQMIPGSVDISSTNPTQNIIPQSEVSGSGVHIRVNGDSENTNLVEVTYSSPALKTMTGLSAAVQASSSNLVVWSSSNKGTCITSSNNQGNLTLDGSGNATIWVEATASGTNTLNFLIVSGTSTIGTSGSLNFVNYDSFTEAFSGETNGVSGAAAAEGTFSVAQRLYLEGYNIAYYDVYFIDPVTGDPAYTELGNEIQLGFVKSVGVFGYSHGGGETYNICSLLNGARGTLGNFNIPFAGYIDAIQHVSSGAFDATHNPFAETQYAPGAAFLWNYYERNTAWLRGNAVPGAGINLNVNTTSWGGALTHYSYFGSTAIDDSPQVQAALKSEIETDVPKY
jgi:hypothetical protein